MKTRLVQLVQEYCKRMAEGESRAQEVAGHDFSTREKKWIKHNLDPLMYLTHYSLQARPLH